MLLTIAFVLFLAQIVAWVVLPSSAPTLQAGEVESTVGEAIPA